MADIEQSIQNHNSDNRAHPYILNALENKANSVHSHGIGDIVNFNRAVEEVINTLVNVEDYPNAEEALVNQGLLNKQLLKMASELAKKIHTHTKEEITDFEHNHDELYYTKAELNEETGATLIGAIIDNFDGTNVQDILTELGQYTTAVKNNFAIKTPVRVVSTSHIAELKGVSQNIDGIENFLTGDRVLVAGQNDSRDNGIYIVQSSNWVRSEDLSKNEDLAENILVFVKEGLEHLHTGWQIECKSNPIGGVAQPLEIGKSGFFCTPFSYNRNLKSSNTIEMLVDPNSNVLEPNLRTILNNLPIDATFGRVKVDEYGRIISGDLLGDNGVDLFLEDYNIVNALTVNKAEEMINEAVGGSSAENAESLKKAKEELIKYTDSEIKDHDNNVNAHKQLHTSIVNEIENSENYFKHNHDDLYYTQTQLSSEVLNNSGAKLIGVNSIDGIPDANNVQSALEKIKQYADSISQSLDIKESVKAATVENITLSGLQIIDTISVLEGDRILVKNQDNATENGFYNASANGWTRTLDGISGKLDTGSFTFVEEGAINNGTGWVLSTPTPIVIGTTELEFIQFSSAGIILAGNGLEKIGNIISMPEIHPSNNSYTKVTVDVLGKVIEGKNPTDISDLGINNVYTKTEVNKIIKDLPLATEEERGMMSKIDKTKLNGIENGAEVNQKAFSHISLNDIKVSSKEKTGVINIETFKGIEGIVEDEILKLSLGHHTHKVADITDFPTSLPANGGNADTLANHEIKDFALVKPWIGSGTELELPPEVITGISNHNISDEAHQDIRDAIKNKADLINGKIPKSQIPIVLDIDKADIAIIGDNGNWWTYDSVTQQYEDTGEPARGEKGEDGKDGLTVSVNHVEPDDTGNITLTPEDIGVKPFVPSVKLPEVANTIMFPVCRLFSIEGGYGCGGYGEVPYGGVASSISSIEIVFDEQTLYPLVSEEYKNYQNAVATENGYSYYENEQTDEQTLFLEVRP